MIWDKLFIHGSPVSEACQGVLTVLNELGLVEFVKSRDLKRIRAWFKEQDRAEYVRRVFKLAGVSYVVMTNIPFEKKEAIHWITKTKYDTELFKPALRVDPLLSADVETLEREVYKRKIDVHDNKTVEELISWLEDWAAKMDPVYLFASSPRGFKFIENPELLEQDCKIFSVANPSPTFFINRVLIPLARKLKLPIGLKLGAARNVSPELSPCGGGDGIADIDWISLECLLRKYPDVKFLVTFLPREAQHRACVLANKFRNLHMYGCWWYCNNPSIIKEIVEMRLEMLGLTFTAQHSDARVLDQLIYKWKHSRQAIAEMLTRRYKALVKTGWNLTKEEVQRDVKLLLGGSYNDFLNK